jgi:hypothetical protein
LIDSLSPIEKEVLLRIFKNIYLDSQLQHNGIYVNSHSINIEKLKRQLEKLSIDTNFINTLTNFGFKQIGSSLVFDQLEDIDYPSLVNYLLRKTETKVTLPNTFQRVSNNNRTALSTELQKMNNNTERDKMRSLRGFPGGGF